MCVCVCFCGYFLLTMVSLSLSVPLHFLIFHRRCKQKEAENLLHADCSPACGRICKQRRKKKKSAQLFFFLYLHHRKSFLTSPLLSPSAPQFVPGPVPEQPGGGAEEITAATRKAPRVCVCVSMCVSSSSSQS